MGILFATAACVGFNLGSSSETCNLALLMTLCRALSLHVPGLLAVVLASQEVECAGCTGAQRIGPVSVRLPYLYVSEYCCCEYFCC
jgi:hypothetical protein